MRNDKALVRNISEFEERFDCLTSLLDESDPGSFVSNTLKEGYMGRVHDNLSAVVEDVIDDIAFVNKRTAFKPDIYASQNADEETQGSLPLDDEPEPEQNEIENYEDDEPTYYISRPATMEANNEEHYEIADEPVIARDTSQEWAHRRHDFMNTYPTDK